MDKKSYLGDGVYVDTCDIGVKLTTENGIEVTNTIYLEAAVIEALILYLRRLGVEVDQIRA